MGKTATASPAPARAARRLMLWQLATLIGAVLTAAAASAAPEAFHDVVDSDQPVLWFTLDETEGDAINHGSLGAGFDATYFGTPHRGEATYEGDGAVRFDSEDDYLETKSVAPEGLAGNPTFTAEAVYYLTPQDFALLWAPFLHWGISDATPTMESVYFSFSGNVADETFAGFYNGGLQSAVLVPRGNWHHFVWVRQGGGAANVGTTMYIDGNVVGTINDPELPFNTSTPAVVNTAFRINRAQNFTRYFTGTLDEVVLYDRMLGSEEVEEHFQALLPCAESDVEGQCLDHENTCRSCGMPISAGSNPLASDALGTLRAAVGSRLCRRCICDVDGSGSVVATDSLLTLKKAVGQVVELSCPVGGLPWH
ncbi:MAG TPA: LamG domain-containing protein [Candidatus Binatia bacterium]|nr:LamG domain-containing protein [Candidatus Binatia bacterium]